MGNTLSASGDLVAFRNRGRPDEYVTRGQNYRKETKKQQQPIVDGP